ncbi:hypothetical protein C5142_23005 [Rhodococcus sp. BGS-1C]|jgi:hypothetical protein|uniref:hypothetical protein n=1 Tax=unclassified Rhodococcus (in: high G+C Gram-positive bacteria) TaxID=192944 RepID=UPI0019CFA790|nr:hypothetical protein [Rhodococcus sp. KRD197]
MGIALNNNYSQLRGLAGVYLQDSYVLSISQAPGEFTFVLDAVLTPESTRYEPPKPGEQYCYARGRLVFADANDIKWVARSTGRYIDANGAVDLGNIDSLRFEQGVYKAEGDWGRVEIRSASEPQFVFD